MSEVTGGSRTFAEPPVLFQAPVAEEGSDGPRKVSLVIPTEEDGWEAPEGWRNAIQNAADHA